MPTIEHVEVAPRMWDKSIAAPYTPSSDTAPLQSDETHDTNAPKKEALLPIKKAVVPVVGIMFYMKRYLPLAILFIGIIVVIYVVFKYITKYRKQNAAVLENNKPTENTKQSPFTDIVNGDTSKYECDSDDESDSNKKTLSKLSSIKEESADDEDSDDVEEEEEGEEEGEEEEEEEEQDEEEYDGDGEEKISILESNGEIEEDDKYPNVKEIEDLLASNAIADVDELDDENFAISMPVYENDVAPEKSTKRSRQRKPVTV